MKISLPLLLMSLFAPIAAHLLAQLTIPSDGSDGALIITSNTVIDLSRVVSGMWSNNNLANNADCVWPASGSKV